MPGDMNKALNTCSQQCASARLDRRCEHNFGSSACRRCNWYVGNYVDGDPRHIKLFQLQNDIDIYTVKAKAQFYKDKKSSATLGKWLIIIILGIFGFLFLNAVKGAPIHTSWPAPKDTPVRIPLDDDYIIRTQGNVNAAIINTLQVVSVMMDRKVDMNGDRKINCIDAALLFYKYYPDKANVCIELNYNPPKMNHLFNCVKINGAWRAVEPQAWWHNYVQGKTKSYFMGDIWGKAYDVRHNEDVTDKYLRYVR